MVRAIPSAVWACQLARCGAVFILMVKEILRRDLDKHVFYRESASRSCTESYYKDFVQRSRQGLLRRFCQQSSFRAFVQDFFHDYCQKPCCRDLVQGSCEDTSYAQRHRTGPCCTDFAKKSRTKILPVFGKRLVANLPTSPLQRSWQEMARISSKDLARRPLIKMLYRDFADILGTVGKATFCKATLHRDLWQESYQEVSYINFAKTPRTENLYKDLARRIPTEIYANLSKRSLKDL